MAEEDRRISLAGKVLVDKIDAQLLEVQKQGQVVGFGVALTMDGRVHRRNERSTTTYLLYSEDIARLISKLLDATTDADPAWRDQVLGLIRLALDLKRGAMRRHCQKRWWRHGQGDSNPGPPSTVVPGRSWAAGLTCDSLEPVITAGARCPPICRSRAYLACTAATSADGAGMLWAKVAHRAPDERPGFGGRRVCF
jgi:hypothetical protein